MKGAYPITINQSDNFYIVFVPDFNINTQGETLTEAMEMARDVIGMTGCYLEDEGKSIPLASHLKDLKANEDELLVLVDVDFVAYRKKHETRTIRKNVSLPSWLNEAAEKANLNVSAVLQRALKEELNL